MSDKSSIEWTEATWSPVTGCTKVSDGCTHCYIDRTPPFRMTGRKFDGDTVGSTTGVKLHSDRLGIPQRWRKPRRIFVCSLADLFQDEVPTRFIADVFAVMSIADRHTYQVLTKRHARMRALLGSLEFWIAVDDARAVRRHGPLAGSGPVVLPNVWLGVSVENQQWADTRIPALLETPAAVRWLSCEPLLGAVSLSKFLHWRPIGENFRDVPMPPDFAEACGLPALHWVVAGGESGLRSRAMLMDWPRSLRDQCAAASVPFFFKQWGGRTPKANGRELDGRTWDEYPVSLPERET